MECPVPVCLNRDVTDNGGGIEIHLSWAAVLDFQEKEGRWPRLHNEEDAEAVLKLAQAISEARKEIEGACWAQKVSSLPCCPGATGSQ